jgi:hypothetical protein
MIKEFDGPMFTISDDSASVSWQRKQSFAFGRGNADIGH